MIREEFRRLWRWEERHRRLGEPTPGSVEESFEELFKLSPLKPGMDTE